MAFWLNGSFRDDGNCLSIADRGFLLGDGLFETLYVKEGVPVFLDDHLERLKSSMAALGIDMRLPDIHQVIQALSDRQQLTKGEASVRVTVTRGNGPRGLLFPAGDQFSPTVLITMAGVLAQPTNVRTVKVSSFPRAESSVAASHKTLNYLDNVLAFNEAADQHLDDAIMLNNSGRVACASVANIFLLCGDVLVTPPVCEGALPGIVRHQLLNAGHVAGFALKEAPIELNQLASGPIFLTNSLMGVVPATLEGSEISPDTEIVSQLRTWYCDAVAKDIRKVRSS